METKMLDVLLITACGCKRQINLPAPEKDKVPTEVTFNLGTDLVRVFELVPCEGLHTLLIYREKLVEAKPKILRVKPNLRFVP